MFLSCLSTAFLERQVEGAAFMEVNFVDVAVEEAAQSFFGSTEVVHGHKAGDITNFR